MVPPAAGCRHGPRTPTALLQDLAGRDLFMGGPRYWEIDALRGTAILMMVVFHTAFSLDFFGVMSLDLATGFWRALALATATLFIAIAGVSITPKKSREKAV